MLHEFLCSVAEAVYFIHYNPHFGIFFIPMIFPFFAQCFVLLYASMEFYAYLSFFPLNQAPWTICKPVYLYILSVTKFAYQIKDCCSRYKQNNSLKKNKKWDDLLNGENIEFRLRNGCDSVWYTDWASMPMMRPTQFSIKFTALIFF